jgi:hypothetical protein
MDHQPAADRFLTQAPTLPRRGVPVDASLSRFSPLTAPEREAVDAFLDENRAWALRQARRSYRHLPESLREQAVQRAFTELRTRAPQSLERRALSAELATRLTEALRHVHVGWCLNESSALLRREGTEPVQPEVRREGLAHFVDEGLGGMERAVLQLEIGAGRDTRTARAALRLGPRQYATHREAGLSKLRDAISAQVIGRACDQHVSSIVAAATGDKTAMEELNAGPHRCRYCAREAQGLRSVLHERLAVAPWPIAIKPAGLLAAKLGAIGAVVGGKGGAGAGALGTVAGGSGASAAATVLAAAALATGTAAIVDNGEDGARKQSSERTAQTVQSKPHAIAAQTHGVAKAAKPHRTRAAHHAAHKARVRAANGGGSSAPAAAGTHSAPSTPSVPATSAPASTTQQQAAPVDAAPSAPAASGPVTTATKPVTQTVNDVTHQVTDTLPPAVGEPVDQTVEELTGTVDDVTGTVDGLLKP